MGSNKPVRLARPPQTAQVLFQARRVDARIGRSQAVFSCSLSKNAEHLFKHLKELLAHVHEYHPLIAKAWPDGSLWKLYLYDSVERAKSRNHFMNFMPPGSFDRPLRNNRTSSPRNETQSHKQKPLQGPVSSGPATKMAQSHSLKRPADEMGLEQPTDAIDFNKDTFSKRSRSQAKTDVASDELLSAQVSMPTKTGGLTSEGLRAHNLKSPLGPDGLSPKATIASQYGSQSGKTATENPQTASLAKGAEDEDATEYDDPSIEVLLQPQTKAITLAQLQVEVDTIRKAVDKLECGCRQAHADLLGQARSPPGQRPPVDYARFIGCHKSYLQEIHDLCLATQHPVASEELKSLPRRINIPARLWQSGVAAPLEILRILLPESREHAVYFVHVCFNMTALFYETVSEFDSTWLECLGDLARYRLGLVDQDDDKKFISPIATYWFRNALDLIPQTGRLRHHLAVLVPNFSIEQLSLYGHALTAYMPFYAARKSLLASLRPVYDDGKQLSNKVPVMDLTFLRAHSALFIGGQNSLAVLEDSVSRLTSGLFDKFVQTAGQEKARLKRFGAHIAIANSAAIFEYGATMSESLVNRSILRHALLTRNVAKTRAVRAPARVSIVQGGDDLLSRVTIYHACRLTFGMLKVALARPRDENLHPMVHISFVMIWAFCNVPSAYKETEALIPWTELVAFLNCYANVLTMKPHILSRYFPHSKPAANEALPEDFMIQGLWYTQDYLPEKWCARADMDHQERLVEKEEHVIPRIERILWLAYGIAYHNKWIVYERETKSFCCKDSYLSKMKSPLPAMETYRELEPLFPPEPQSSAPTVSWNSDAPSRQGVLDHGSGVHPQLLTLFHRWSDFRQQCENFFSQPQPQQDLMRDKLNMGKTIAQDFLSELESVMAPNGQRLLDNEPQQFQTEKNSLRIDMHGMIQKIHGWGQRYW